MTTAGDSLAAAASASASSTAPRKFGCWKNTAPVSPSIACAHACASVTPSRSPTSTMSAPNPAAYVASVSRLWGCSPREFEEVGVDLLLRHPGGQVKRPVQAHRRRDRLEQLADRADADRREHLADVLLRGRRVAAHALPAQAGRVGGRIHELVLLARL